MTAVKNFIRRIFAFIATVFPGIKKLLSVDMQVKLGINLTGDEYKKYTLHGIYPALYKKYASQPVDNNKVVFIEVRHPKVTNSYQLLFDRLHRDYNFDIRIHFLRDPFAPREEQICRSKEMIMDIATAKYIFIDDGSNVLASLPIRKETTVTQLWHGCGAFKKFGFSTAELIFGNTREEMMKYPNHYMYDNVTVSSPEVIWAYEEAFGLENKKGSVKAIGCSRTDIFYDKRFIQEAKQKLARIMPSSVGKKVILYAPTFRGRVKNATTPDLLNVAQFARELSDEYVLIFKHHPLIKKFPKIDEIYSDFAKDFTDAMSIEELICVSDICISDYSSLIFEYSLFEKPMIFFAYDLSEYFDWRGFYYDYDELAPGPIFKSNTDMIEYIKNIDTLFDKQRVHNFREKFMSSCDGHATDRLLDVVFGKELKEHLKPVDKRFDIKYHLVPNAKLLPSEADKKIADLKAKKIKTRNIYESACTEPIEKNKVIFIGSSPTAGASILLEKLKASTQLNVVDTGNLSLSDEEIIKEIATARFIILNKKCTLTDFIPLRSGSEIIQLWNFSVPVKRFSYASLKYKSGLQGEYYSAASQHKNYSLVPVCTDYAAKAFSESFGCSIDVTKKIGSVHTDVFFDEERKKSIIAKITRLFPASANKKIIFYAPQQRKDITVKPNKPAFVNVTQMYEKLKDRYVMIIDYPVKQANKIKAIGYYDDFIYNIKTKIITDEENPLPVSTGLTASDIMSVADITIGDYNSVILDFLAADKPLLFYAPDATVINSVNNALTDYFELTEDFRFNDTASLVEQIDNLNTYNYTRLREIKGYYIGECDGKVSDRIAQYILSGVNDNKKAPVTA